MMKPWWLASALLLANVSAAQGQKALREEFRNPSLRYRMNVNRHSMPREERAQDSMIRWILDNGYRGMATNVNPDDYLRSDDELAVFNRFVHAAKKQGLDLWLYDERSYPSGMAHTYVLEGHPEWEAEGLLFRDTTVRGGTTLDLAALPGERVLVRALPVTECGLDYDRSLDLSAFVRDGRLRWLAPEGRWTVAEINHSALYEGYQAGTDRGGGYAPRYPSLLLEDVTRRFIETTHRRYASAFDEPLGELFTSTFTDEPSLMAQPYQNPGYGVYPWKENVSAEFRSRYGLSLEDGLLRLMLDEGPEGQKLRYRYFRVVTDLLTRNYFGQIRDYCHTQKLLSGGHLLLEECMMAHVPLYGDIMACYRAMDIPGIDNLTGMPAFTRRYLYSSRLASSAAELEGRSRMMVESCPISDYPFHGGKEAPTQQVKGTLNRMILGGATDFNNYLQLQHEDAAGRTAVNEYVARVVGMLSGGVRASRIAVYYPIETLWTKFRPLPSGLLSWDDIAGGAPRGAAAVAAVRPRERLSDGQRLGIFLSRFPGSRGVRGRRRLARTRRSALGRADSARGRNAVAAGYGPDRRIRPRRRTPRRTERPAQEFAGRISVRRDRSSLQRARRRRGTCSPGRLLRTAVRARTAEYAARRHSYARHRLCASQGYSLCS